MRRNRPSRSALKVAHAVTFVALEPEVAALLPAGLAATSERLLRSSGLLTDKQLRRMASPRFRRFFYWVDSFAAGGQLLFVALRKRLVADEAAAAIRDGCRQVLVVGGGLDTLALRLAGEHPGLRIVEVDHPASQELKREALAQLGPLPPNLHLVPSDLAKGELAAALAALPAWDAAAPTIVAAEAVLMYLDRGAVERAFRHLHDGCGPGSTLVFSYIRRDVRGRLLLGRLPRLAALGLALGGEPLGWAVGEGELAGVLAGAGWRLEIERVDLRQRYLLPAGLGDRPLADVEVYARARRA